MSGSITVGGKVLASHDNVSGKLSMSENVDMSNMVFPAGHVISHSIPFFDNGVASSIETSSTSYQETGIEVSLTTKLSSSDSRIVVQFYTGFARMIGNISAITIWTVGRSTASSTTYASATDLTDDQSSYFYPGATNTYWSQHSTWIDTGSYLADTTYYYQIYLRSYVSYTTQLARQGATVSLLAYEVKI